MKISFLNEQDKFPVGFSLKALIKKAAKASLRYLDFPTKAEISVMLTDNQGIRTLNAEHRNIDSATDVLSFPMFEYDQDGNIIQDYEDSDDLCLGDIVISLERAAEQAKEYGHSLNREVGFLVVHSMLHLLGYDHMEPDEEAEMFQLQREILNSIKLSRE